MIFKKKVGIVSFGSALPDYKIDIAQIERSQNKQEGSISGSLFIEQKTVPGTDEDTATLSVQAGFEALHRWSEKQNKKKIGALFIGSESHPYAVKPTGTIVKAALGLADEMALADLQFACKAGTQALQVGLNYILSGMSEYALAIGSDTAQSATGDALEFSAGAGAGAFILGKRKILVKVLASGSLATDTPDFWRRPGQNTPQHAGRFTAEPAYFHHVFVASKNLLSEADLEPSEIDFCVFHTPNGKFPRIVAQKLGFRFEQLAPSLVVNKIGNSYAAASILGLVAVLEQAREGQKILFSSYGSGAGADSFILETTHVLPKFMKKLKEKTLQKKIEKLKTVQ